MYSILAKEITFSIFIERTNTMHCIHCGALLPEGAKFCTSCGLPVQAAPTASEEPVIDSPVETAAQETADTPQAPINASEGYKAANAQLPPSYSNPNYSSQARPSAAAPSTTNGLAIAGFICSLIFIPVGIGVLCAIAGLILSIMGMSSAKKLPENKGHGLALAGTIISAVRIVLLLIAIIAFLALMIRGVGHVGHELIANWSEYVPYTY